MTEVCFYERVDDERLKFAVIVARHRGQWVFCRHRERSTYECPGGHREAGEPIEQTARRELWEETGATGFSLAQICAYGVRKDGEQDETCGMLYHADINALGELPSFEIAEVRLFDTPPDNQTYPDIQPFLLKKAEESRSASQR